MFGLIQDQKGLRLHFISDLRGDEVDSLRADFPVVLRIHDYLFSQFFSDYYVLIEAYVGH